MRTDSPIRKATKIAPRTYCCAMNDGRTLTITVPPSACRACGGEGCKRCEATDGYEPEAVRS